ncbi:helix-turn-helix domain-containing protein [Maribellus sediminis]|uniref:helix-turn-helix domain-containing protein n=1 Tax=Maribellus sediminis TaxID=2696285 RepID=UPI001430451A
MVIESFSKVLRDIRLNRKLSQEKLAELSDLDRTYISLLERGLRQPTITTLFQICSALEISPSEFVRQMEESLNDR